MILFMDISRSEGGEVLSVVGGCRECGSRIVSLFIDDTSRWLRHHQRTTHPQAQSAIEQIGDPKELTQADQVLEIIRLSGEPITSSEAAKELDIPQPSAAQILLRLFQEGVLERSKLSSRKNAPYHYSLKRDAA
jgi:hypothetical protein